ncbi:MAG: BrnT family toxin [Zymomonas sp.]|nr:MAG: BrnT family toxin [Zymomonas sp.]
MQFAWDPGKAQSNLSKHQVSFALAERVFDDPLHIVAFDRVVDGEERWHALGVVGSLLVLLVVHTYPDGDDGSSIRIIGARKATPQERRMYEQGFD